MKKQIIKTIMALILGGAVLVSCGTLETDTTDVAETDTIATADIYVSGVYSSILWLENQYVELQIVVDKDNINSIDLINMDDSVARLYPLIEPTLQELSETIIEKQSIEGISYNYERRYTSELLMQAITEALDKAYVSQNTEGSE